MNPTLLFNLAFTAQILGLSFFLPRYLLSKNIRDSKNAIGSQSIIRRYRLMNIAMVIIGFLVLDVLSFHPVFTSVVFILLIIGIYFLLQIFPLVVNKQLIKLHKVRSYYDHHSFAPTNVIHPFVIGIAVILFLSYLTKSLIDWNGSLNTQLLQAIIFIGINTYLVFTLGNIIRKIKRNTGEERLKQISFFSKAAPLFIYLGIGISMYYFGKMLLLNFELNEYRPIMMSISLLMVGFAIFKTIVSNIPRNIVNRMEV